MQPVETINVGDVVTVLNGKKQRCPAGCCVVGEAYEDCKGLPLVVMAVDWPYIITAHLATPGGRVIDARRVKLTKCSGDYVAGFKTMLGVHAKPTRQPVETIQVRISGHDGPGDAVPVE